ncbi:putative two-component response regulator [Salinisphaera sp. S4-8]
MHRMAKPSNTNAYEDAREIEKAQSAPEMVGLIRQQLDAGFRWLRFEPVLEREFRAHNDAAGVANRIALLAIALTVLLISPLFDTAFFGVPPMAAWWSRVLLIGVLGPVTVVALIWCARCGASSATEYVIAGQFTIVSFGLLFNHILLNRYGAEFPVEFVGVSMVAVVALGRVRSWLILPVAVLIALLTLITEIWLVNASPTDYYHLAAAGVLALFAIYLQAANEYVLRRSWLDRKLLQLVARHDGLTGLLNRHALENALATAHGHAVRQRSNYGLAMVDIDQFGAYNNHYGHPAGDEALRQVASVIEAHARRPLDVCGRYGGEEFVVFWIEGRENEIEDHAEALRAAIEDAAIAHATSKVASVVTVSIGLCHVKQPQEHDSLSAVLACADALLYEAKAAGRNRVAIGRFDRNAADAQPHARRAQAAG